MTIPSDNQQAKSNSVDAAASATKLPQQLPLLDAIVDTAAQAESRLGDIDRGKVFRGVSQLSVVEHALCPLDTKASLQRGMVYDNHFYRYPNGRAERIDVEIGASFGFSSADELLLWGLFALVCHDQEEGSSYWATPHYVLRRLGLKNKKRGGKNYRDFRASLKRIGGLSLYCKQFFDPLLEENREVTLRFVHGSMPSNADSSRAYRFVFDPELLAMLRHRCGGIRFDFETYRNLGVAERRAFLALSKIYHRRKKSPNWDVRHFCVNVLGYSDTLTTNSLKKKLRNVLRNLLAADIITFSNNSTTIEDFFMPKKQRGEWSIRIPRGRYYTSSEPQVLPQRSWRDTPLYDPLRSIGFEDRDIRWFIGNYSSAMLTTWCDVTLAGIEGRSRDFPGFKKDPQAFFRHHIKAHAAREINSAPDWYQTLIKREEREQRQLVGDGYTKKIESYRVAYEQAKSKSLQALVATDQANFDKRVRMLLAVAEARGDRLTERVKNEATDNALRFYERELDFPGIDVWIASNS